MNDKKEGILLKRYVFFFKVLDDAIRKLPSKELSSFEKVLS